MRIFPPITVGTDPTTFDPAAGRRQLKYMRIKSIAGGQTAYMGPTTTITGVVLASFSCPAGTLRIDAKSFPQYLAGEATETPGAYDYIQPGWMVTGGVDTGVTVKRVYDGFVEFSSALSFWDTDSIPLSPPYEVNYTNGYPILASDTVEITDPDVLRGPLSFATASGTATLHILFELT